VSSRFDDDGRTTGALITLTEVGVAPSTLHAVV
jgi:hypothetical protein